MRGSRFFNGGISPKPPSPDTFYPTPNVFQAIKNPPKIQQKTPKTLINKQIEKEKLKVSNFPQERVVVVRGSNAYFSEAYNFFV